MLFKYINVFDAPAGHLPPHNFFPDLLFTTFHDCSDWPDSCQHVTDGQSFYTLGKKLPRRFMSLHQGLTLTQFDKKIPTHSLFSDAFNHILHSYRAF